MACPESLPALSTSKSHPSHLHLPRLYPSHLLLPRLYPSHLHLPRLVHVEEAAAVRVVEARRQQRPRPPHVPAPRGRGGVLRRRRVSRGFLRPLRLRPVRRGCLRPVAVTAASSLVIQMRDEAPGPPLRDRRDRRRACTACTLGAHGASPGHRAWEGVSRCDGYRASPGYRGRPTYRLSRVSWRAVF